MISNVTYTSAFIGGILAFFSPCIIPVLPMYVGFLSGDLEGKDKRKLYINSIAFLIGLSMINLFLGAGASVLGQAFIRNRMLFSKIAGIFIIFMGLFQVGIINPNFLLKERKLNLKLKGGKFITSFLLGIGFSFGWTPCVSAILAPILTLVANDGSLSVGIFALGLYSIGFMLPFLVSTFFMAELMQWVNKSEKILKNIKVASGIIMIIMGLLLYNNLLYKLMFL